MSALGDTLATKNREYVLKCKIVVAVDTATTAVAATYSLLLEAPEMSETLLEDQSLAQLTTAIAEFTDWVTATW